MLERGVWAEIWIAGEHLRLFAEENAQGIQASVFDVKNNRWILPSEQVENIELGKERAIACARAHLHNAALQLPRLVWKEARSK